MNLDFSLFPVIDEGYLVAPQPKASIKVEPEVYDRFCSAIYFADSIGAERTNYMISPSAQAEAYLRSSLSEFVSIEELLKVKYPKEQSCYSLIKTKNPHFHFLKQLRNYNVHLRTVNVGTKEIQVRIASQDTGEVHKIDSYYIGNLDLNEFLKLDCFTKYKSYTVGQFDRIIELFEIEQRKFGVGDLIIKAILDYSIVIEKFLTSRSRLSS